MADRKSSPVTIKKYANRRLYNTATSTYVTLEDLAKMVKEGTEFNVYDAKSGEDITRSVLTQIIMEAENSGTSMLPVPFLRQLIGFYGGNMEPMLGKYLEQSLSAFSGNQEKMREMMTHMTGGMFPVGSLEEMGKQNMAMFERTMKMFTPMAGGDVQEAGKRMREQSEKSLAELQDQLDKLQRQIGDIMKGGRK
jgi:polyhydroxyalkanoate synthesis repressor PhaR